MNDEIKNVKREMTVTEEQAVAAAVVLVTAVVVAGAYIGYRKIVRHVLEQRGIIEGQVL